MVKLDGGPFLMGTEEKEGFPADGEGPIRTVKLDPLLRRRHPRHQRPVRRVRQSHKLQNRVRTLRLVVRLPRPPDSQPVRRVRRGHRSSRTLVVQGPEASWDHPEGPDTGITARPDTPVTQILLE